MMDRDEAHRLAQTYLDGERGGPNYGVYQVDPPANGYDVGWAWVFSWNTARYDETGHVQDGMGPGSGPLVIVKDTKDIWMVGSAFSTDDWLRNYAEQHGYQHSIRYDPPAPDLRKLADERRARMPAMTREEAAALTQDFLDKMATPSRQLAVGDPDDAVDVGFAWLIPWNSKRFYQTGNPKDADKHANAPMIITKDTQRITRFNNLEPIDQQVLKYAERNGYHPTPPTTST